MAEMLFPERVRCVTCRKKLFEDDVLSGKYCSVKCGKLSPVVEKVADAPRGCKRSVNNVWEFKRRYSSVSSVPLKYREDPASNIYECGNCHRFHIGHSRPDSSHNPLKDDLLTVVDSFAHAGEVIRKYRESVGIDRRDLAKMLKIPAVRIKEVEEGDRKASAAVLFTIISALRLKLTISGRAPKR